MYFTIELKSIENQVNQAYSHLGELPGYSMSVSRTSRVAESSDRDHLVVENLCSEERTERRIYRWSRRKIK